MDATGHLIVIQVKRTVAGASARQELRDFEAKAKALMTQPWPARITSISWVLLLPCIEETCTLQPESRSVRVPPRAAARSLLGGLQQLLEWLQVEGDAA